LGKPHNPRRGSMQFWPRKRAKHSLARIRTWAPNNKSKALGFIGYKAGMTHLHIVDQRTKSLTKGEKIFMPVTIVECPPMTIYGISFYKMGLISLKKSTSIFANKLSKELSKKLQLPKKNKKTIEEITEFDDLILLIHSNPVQTGIGVKKPKLLELALGGSKEEKLAFAKENLGKEINISDVFEAGELVDAHGITKGKGFQGTVKRFGVPIRQHKSEKTKRGIGNLGAWTPKRVDFRVPQPGKMGYHLRTDHNKQIIKVGQEGQEITPNGGIKNYGVVKSNYILVSGSLMGPKKRALVLTHPIRPNLKFQKTTPNINYIKA
jgi:large subunit ribosomal protein L3